MKFRTVIIAPLAFPLLASCQAEKRLSPEEQARQEAYTCESDRVARVDCALVDTRPTLQKMRIPRLCKRRRSQARSQQRLTVGNISRQVRSR